MDEQNEVKDGVTQETIPAAKAEEAIKLEQIEKTRINAGIKTNGSKFVRLYFNEDGSPLRRKVPKVRMSKKERRRQRKLNKEED